MARQINLRQIEAFKAVVENGTMVRAAELLNISQPAMSKLIAHLEFDTGLKLFDRLKGRLAPTEHGMRLYDEVGRIFAGVRQVENAVEAIRREEKGRLTIGVMPALAGSFLQRAATGFLIEHNVFCMVQSLSSQWILDWLIARKLDVGIVDAGLDNPYLHTEPLMSHPLVCIMPIDHPLAAKKRIEPDDLNKIPFISSHPDTYVGGRLAAMFETYGVESHIVMIANIAPTICEFVAAGLGVSLVPPLAVSGFEHRLAIRRFEPDISFSFQLCRNIDNRNAQLIDAFAARMHETAEEICRTTLALSDQ